MATNESDKGLGLSLDLRIGSLNDAVTTLVNTLKDQTEQGRELAETWINKVYDYAHQIRENWSGTESEEGGADVAKDAYYRAVNSLRDAAKAGQQKAADALKSLGEQLEVEEEAVGAGHTRKSAASKAGKAPHASRGHKSR